MARNKPYSNEEGREKWNAYNRAYQSNKYKSISLKFHKEADKELIDFVYADPRGVSECVKDAIRKAMK